MWDGRTWYLNMILKERYSSKRGKKEKTVREREKKRKNERRGGKWEKEKGGGEGKKKTIKGVEQPSCRWQQINIHPSVHRH